MTSSFAERFDSYFAARQDYTCYLAAKGYRPEGDQLLWEPQDPSDLASEAEDYRNQPCEEF